MYAVVKNYRSEKPILEDTMQCERCGADIAEESSFCGQCGAPKPAQAAVRDAAPEVQPVHQAAADPASYRDPSSTGRDSGEKYRPHLPVDRVGVCGLYCDHALCGFGHRVSAGEFNAGGC